MEQTNFKIYSKSKFIEYLYQIDYKDKMYNVRFKKYGECIDILSIVYLCDKSTINEPNNKIYYDELYKYETIYKQIELLLKEYVLNEV